MTQSKTEYKSTIREIYTDYITNAYYFGRMTMYYNYPFLPWTVVMTLAQALLHKCPI